MNSNDKRRIMTKAGSATTAAGYAEAWGDLEQTVDQAAERIKNEYASSEERIRSARYRPDEQRKQLTEARAYAADRLQTLRTDYETTREDLLSTAVHRAFSSGSLIGSDAINRRDATMKAASVEGPGEAQEMLGRAMRADDGELVAALAREANQQGWWNIIRQIRAEGTSGTATWSRDAELGGGGPTAHPNNQISILRLRPVLTSRRRGDRRSGAGRVKVRCTVLDVAGRYPPGANHSASVRGHRADNERRSWRAMSRRRIVLLVGLTLVLGASVLNLAPVTEGAESSARSRILRPLTPRAGTGNRIPTTDVNGRFTTTKVSPPPGSVYESWSLPAPHLLLDSLQPSRPCRHSGIGAWHRVLVLPAGPSSD